MFFPVFQAGISYLLDNFAFGTFWTKGDSSRPQLAVELLIEFGVFDLALVQQLLDLLAMFGRNVDFVLVRTQAPTECGLHPCREQRHIPSRCQFSSFLAHLTEAVQPSTQFRFW